MKRYCFTSLADDDIFKIWVFIATKDVAAADRLETDIFDACASLAELPDLGHWRRDLTDKPVRFFPVRGSYLIIYNPTSEPLEIIRVLHGARNLPDILK